MACQTHQPSHFFHRVVPHAVKHLRVCGQHMSVCWYLSILHYERHITQVCVVVQLHYAVEHLDFAGGLLLLRWGLPPQDLNCSAHEVMSRGWVPPLGCLADPRPPPCNPVQQRMILTSVAAIMLMTTD